MYSPPQVFSAFANGGVACALVVPQLVELLVRGGPAGLHFSSEWDR